MSSNEIIDRALTQARNLQKTIGDAVNQTTEQMKPLIQQSLSQAQDLQKTLNEHTVKASGTAQEAATKALGHLAEFMRLGSEALRASSDQTRQMAERMAEQSRKTAADAAQSMGKTPEDAAP
ncbi:MAG: hypothetical protein JO036_11395 [Candidatus Eremiobacteraeota bacterium]|nr:hypothetical protein [Candidatus Eremiobacteraeota bacterium]MBV8369514.1 hypothetical protein [Candidatus Eremiobacteraeota bacterium]